MVSLPAKNLGRPQKDARKKSQIQGKLYMQIRTFLTLIGILSVSSPTVFADFPPEWDRRESIENGWIYDDFDSAVKKAKETDKPLFVVLRCPP